jgi:hypothetical protein
MKFTGLNWTRRSLLFVQLGLLLCCINACGQSTASAKVFIASLYKGYQVSKPPNYLGGGADTVLTPAFLGLVRRDEDLAKGEVGILDYDPICGCQDFDISNVRIKTNPAGKNKLEADVHFTNFGSEVIIGFALEGDGIRWRIADIRSKSTPSLYKYLEAKLNPSAKGN